MKFDGVYALEIMQGDENNSQLEQLVNGLLADFQLSKPTSKPGKKKKASEEDLIDMLRAFMDVSGRLKRLEAENNRLKARVCELEKGGGKTSDRSGGFGIGSYAAKVASSGSEFSAAVVKAVASNAKQAANRASRIVVTGICDLTNSDSQTAMNSDRDQVIRATGSKVTVKSVRRMWKMSRSSDQKASNTIPLIVELGPEDEKITVLGNS